MVGPKNTGITTAFSVFGLVSAMGGADIRYECWYPKGWIGSARARDRAECKILFLDNVQSLADQSMAIQDSVRQTIRARRTPGHGRKILTILGITGDMTGFVNAFGSKALERIPERCRYIAPVLRRREP